VEALYPAILQDDRPDLTAPVNRNTDDPRWSSIEVNPQGRSRKPGAARHQSVAVWLLVRVAEKYLLINAWRWVLDANPRQIQWKGRWLGWRCS
jgi:hypothetical protein